MKTGLTNRNAGREDAACGRKSDTLAKGKEKTMAVLICGGAGYIGSHMVHALVAEGEKVFVVDNLQTGYRQAVHPKAVLYEGDIRDPAVLDRIFTENTVDAVLHFAANSLVGESMEKPLLYFNNNVHGMQILLESMVRHGVDKIVFSSTAAVYGEPRRVPIREEDPAEPTNTYGETKLVMEKMMKWVGRAHGVRFVSLRYFNVAGALEDGSIGEAHQPETHLIPLILQAALGQREAITIYGEDYDTPDGTCIRDYIHVLDLVDAHTRALAHLREGGPGGIFNLGNGQGFSVREMIAAAREITGQPFTVRQGPRRPGDPARLVAAADRARDVLGWIPRRTAVAESIHSAWKWHESHPRGYIPHS